MVVAATAVPKQQVDAQAQEPQLLPHQQRNEHVATKQEPQQQQQLTQQQQ